MIKYCKYCGKVPVKGKKQYCNECRALVSSINKRKSKTIWLEKQRRNGKIIYDHNQKTFKEEMIWYLNNRKCICEDCAYGISSPQCKYCHVLEDILKESGIS